MHLAPGVLAKVVVVSLLVALAAGSHLRSLRRRWKPTGHRTSSSSSAMIKRQTCWPRCRIRTVGAIGPDSATPS